MAAASSGASSAEQGSADRKSEGKPGMDEDAAAGGDGGREREREAGRGRRRH